MSRIGGALSDHSAWKIVNLPDVAVHFCDGPFGSNLKSSHYVDSGVRVIRLQNIGVGEMLNDDLAFISREHYERLPRNHCRPGDVIIGTLGEPNLRACLVPDSLTESLNKADCLLLRVNESLAYPPYICRVLNSDQVVNRASGLIRGQTRGRISLGRVKALSIPLPPLDEQKRIAAILDATDALRAKRREALAQLDTLLQSVFLDMFGDPVTNPMGWGEQDFGGIAQGSFRNGLSPSTKGLVSGEVLTLSAITRGGFDFSQRKSAQFDRSPAASQLLSMNTFLICRGNGNKKLVGVGVFPDRESDRVCFPDTMIGVSVDPSIVAAEYLDAVWRSRRVRSQIESGARTTNGTHKVNQRALSDVVLPVPPVRLQRRFGSVVARIERQRTAQRAHLSELDTLFASLQSRAFQGEL